MADLQPLRVLVITSRPLVDPADRPITLLDVAEERKRIRTALKNAGAAINVHFLPDATTGAINDALSRAWDVVHITGHGAPDGSLWFEDEFGVGQPLSARELLRMFGAQIPRVVVLSLCFSGRQAAEALRQAGVGAVVAIKADQPIADRAATLFNGQFYSSLSQGQLVSEAFTRAQTRVALDAQVGDQQPPLDDADKPEEPWSRRFYLIGDGNLAFTDRVYKGEYAETGALDGVARNLRERNANFVGRAKEIVRLVKEFDLAKARRVAIWGSGGLGKTELSKAVAWWYVERARVEAVLWASASRDEGEYQLRDLASLLSIAGRVFDLPVSEQMNFDEQKAIVRGFLGARSALLILDNWETLKAQDRRELWNFVLNLPDTVRVVVTSREVLPARDARNIELDTLAPDDAAQLFLNIARNAGYFDRNPRLSTEEMAILSSIIEKLGGYPLAVEVVAGQTESRTLSDIWSDLVRIPKNVLEGKDELTGEPRGVWTSLGFSYDVLPEPEQAMFRQMGVFLAPASPEDIAAITQIEDPRVTLDVLVRRSLVRMNEGRYALLPIVRDYAEGRLQEAGQDPREVHVRAVRYFEGQGTLEGALIASEHLYELATRFDSRQAAESFVEYTGGFYQDLVTRGYWSEARRKIQQRIGIARALEDGTAEAESAFELANMYYRLGDYDRAMALYGQMQALFTESDDKRGIASTKHAMGMLAQDQGNYAEALRLYGESMKLKEELVDKSGIASTKHQMGMLAQDQGNYAEALRLYGESLALEEELGDKSGIASTKHQMGMLARDHGNYAEALRLYDESLKLKEELGDKRGIAQTKHEMGNVAYLQGNYTEALRLYDESLKFKEELGDKSGIAGTKGAMGNVAYSQGNYTEALRLYGENLALAEELVDKRGIASTKHQMGMLAQDHGNYAEALRLYGESLALEEKLGNKSGIARTKHEMGNIAYLQGNHTEALRLYDESLKLKEELGDKSGIATTLGQLGQLARAQGQFKGALAYFVKALVIFEDLHSLYRDQARRTITSIRDAIGEEQFTVWLKELAANDERAAGLVEAALKSVAGARVAEYQGFVQAMAQNAQTVLNVRANDSPAQQANVAQQLAGAEQQARSQNAVEVADYFAVLRGLLLGEEMKDKIAALAEPLKQIAEETQIKIWEIEVKKP